MERRGVARMERSGIRDKIPDFGLTACIRATDFLYSFLTPPATPSTIAYSASPPTAPTSSPSSKRRAGMKTLLNALDKL